MRISPQTKRIRSAAGQGRHLRGRWSLASTMTNSGDGRETRIRRDIQAAKRNLISSLSPGRRRASAGHAGFDGPEASGRPQFDRTSQVRICFQRAAPRASIRSSLYARAHSRAGTASVHATQRRSEASVTLTGRSWNQIVSWLRRIDRFRCLARTRPSVHGFHGYGHDEQVQRPLRETGYGPTVPCLRIVTLPFTVLISMSFLPVPTAPLP
jgi:hypothetical protein